MLADHVAIAIQNAQRYSELEAAKEGRATTEPTDDLAVITQERDETVYRLCVV